MMHKRVFYNWLITVVLILHVSNAFSYSLNFSKIDSLPVKVKKKIFIVPFQYKQSALYHAYTYKVIDSVVDILLAHDSITLSLEGFAHVDEGSDSICYYLSLNRALVVRNYLIGRGLDSNRIVSITGFGNLRSAHIKIYKKIIEYNCRVEMVLNYPLPPPPPVIADVDGDGITDTEDGCPTEYGRKENNGCPDKNAIIIPFEIEQSFLYSPNFTVLDSVITILNNNPALTMVIIGHAYKNEGSESACIQLAKDRADITKKYLLSRNISPSRIDAVKSLGRSQPITAGRNFWEIARNSRAEIFLIAH